MKKTNAQEKITLNVEKRDITGKKVNQLRKKGLIPANIYGPEFKSVSISFPIKEFMAAYKVAHETGIIYIALDSKEIPTLIKHVQYDPIMHTVLHADFRKINLAEKIETTVPVQTVGDSVAVNQLGGVLLTQHDHLSVEALPTDIPQHIEVDISPLKELGADIKVSDLPKSDKYTILDDPSIVIVSVVEHKEESTIAETATVAPEVITEKPEEGEEAAAPNEAPEEKKE